MISSTMPEKNEERWDPSLFCPPFFLPLFSAHSVHSVGSHISKCINIYTAFTSISRLIFSLFAFGIDAIPLISLQLDAYILLAFSQLASRLNSIFIFPRQLYQSPTAPLSAFCIPHALPRRLGSVPISSLHARHTHPLLLAPSQVTLLHCRACDMRKKSTSAVAAPCTKKLVSPCSLVPINSVVLAPSFPVAFS